MCGHLHLLFKHNFLRFTHVVACITSFLFIAEECKSGYNCFITCIICKYFCPFRGCLFPFLVVSFEVQHVEF